MSLGLLGRKIGMTQIFSETGDIIPVSVLRVGPCIITQINYVSASLHQNLFIFM